MVLLNWLRPANWLPGKFPAVPAVGESRLYATNGMSCTGTRGVGCNFAGESYTSTLRLIRLRNGRPANAVSLERLKNRLRGHPDWILQRNDKL